MTPIPDKAYFRIGEVSRIVGVKPYVLRFWETEFKSVRPQKSRSQQRLYRRKDIEQLLKIKQLLYEERFTIAGAKQRLKEKDATLQETGAKKGHESALRREMLQKIRGDLKEILKLVE